MSLRVSKRPPTPAATAGGSGRDALPPALIAATANRLAPFALSVAIVTAVYVTLDYFGFHHFNRPGQVSPPWLISLVGGIGLSLTVAWIARSKLLPPEKLLDLGLLYEVLEAFFLSLIFHDVPPPPDYMPRGWSGVAVWILFFPLIIPNTRRKTIAATLAAAAMDPAGLLLDNAVAGRSASAGSWLLMISTAVAVCIAIFVYGIVYRLSVEAGRSLEIRSYHLEKLLGRGGMGEVWQASHRLLARSSAIKLIRPESVGDPDAVKRFEREARATAALRSPHTVEIYDFGTTEDGAFYYVMALLEGFDAQTLVCKHGPLPPERAIHLLRQACKSLEEAHARQLVHRDIKPANIFVCRYGLECDFVKVLDFGLVKGGGPLAGETSLTGAGVITGTVDYMAPEIARGDALADHRADLYALGCVAYWLLTGKHVFDGATPMEVLIDHVRTLPVPPSKKSGVPIPSALEN
ncbi:MAG TPA: serine/threonine-protein kinase, partial [Thermoanaerobaculia bacterium]